jgi:serine O-acetyltransferase
MTDIKDIIDSNVKLMCGNVLAEYAFAPLCGAASLPNPSKLKEFIVILKDVFFPGFFSEQTSCEALLREQMYSLSLLLEAQLPADGSADRTVEMFLARLPEIRRLLCTDVQAMYDNDPAAKSKEEVIICYPSILAMIHYRVAHELFLLGVPLVPRIITEQAHSATGIDIHPAASIGEYFSIDHGTGVVIGETTIIGNKVHLYKGVTLGARNFVMDESGNPVNVPRHPIIEDNVVIYSNATVLGRITIGHDSVIGGNVWLTNSVPPFSRIVQLKAANA